MDALGSMRDQAVRTALCIPARIVARMARVNRTTLVHYELNPSAVVDEVRRERIAAVYRDLRVLLVRHPLDVAA